MIGPVVLLTLAMVGGVVTGCAVIVLAVAVIDAHVSAAHKRRRPRLESRSAHTTDNPRLTERF